MTLSLILDMQAKAVGYVNTLVDLIRRKSLHVIFKPPYMSSNELRERLLNALIAVCNYEQESMVERNQLMYRPNEKLVVQDYSANNVLDCFLGTLAR
ncbi:hypothetical protein ACOME3_007794 [Neoechinorhynchus agilis]